MCRKQRKAPRKAGRGSKCIFADTSFNQTAFNIIDNQFKIVGNVLLEVIGVPFGLFNTINRFVPTHKNKPFQPCFILFSIVIHEDVNIRRILPQRLRYFLKVSSSMLLEEKINLSQLSVSIHSLRAISNFESISARLWGYCASEMFAKTLDEDFLI
jgi:hypothetical protein